MRNILKISTFLSFLILYAPAALLGQSIQLSYNLSSGKIYQLKSNTEQTISMDIMGQEMVINQQIEVFQDVEVKNIDNEGNHTLDYTYIRVRLNQNAMGMEVKYDSDNQSESDDPMVQQLSNAMKDVVGRSVKVVFNRLGHPISSDMDDFFPENVNVSGAESGMLSIYPDKEIQVGDSWEVEVDVDMAMDIKVGTTFTLNEIKGNDAIISFEGNVENIIDQETKAHIDGQINGKLIVDITSGWTKSATYNQHMTMDMEEDGVRMPMQLNSVTTMISD